MNIVVISTKLNDVKVVFIIVFDQVTNVVYQSVLYNTDLECCPAGLSWLRHTNIITA